MEDNKKKYNNKESESTLNRNHEFEVNTGFSDIEMLPPSDDDGDILMARGRRYGRMWLLKGVRPDAKDREDARERLLNEFEVLSRLHDPGVVRAVGIEEIDGLGLCVVEEWVEGTTLGELIRSAELSSKVKARLMRDIIGNVEYINGRGVEHGEINLSNVMVRQGDGSVVLVGFGSSKLGADFRNDVAGLGEIMRHLCSDRKKLAGRCMSRSDKERPGDAADVKRMFDRRKRYISVFARIMAAILMAALLVMAWLSVDHGKKASAEAKEQLEILNENNLKEQNKITELREELRRAGELEDSLNSRVEWNKNYVEKRKTAYSEGCRQIDKAINDFDKNIFPKFERKDGDFYDSVVALRERLMTICARAASPKDFPELRGDDALKLENELIEHYMIRSGEFCREWYRKLDKKGSVGAE